MLLSKYSEHILTSSHPTPFGRYKPHRRVLFPAHGRRPPSRTTNSKFPLLEKNAGAYNAGGQSEVQDRARRLTDPAILAEYGDGWYPLHWVYDKGGAAWRVLVSFLRCRRYCCKRAYARAFSHFVWWSFWFGVHDHPLLPA